MKKIILVVIALIFPIICIAPQLFNVNGIDKLRSFVEHKDKMAQYSIFMEHLSLRESNHQWDVINPIGCMGKYQFAPNTLRRFGYSHITPVSFRQDPQIFPEELQDEVLIALLKSNEIALRGHFVFIGRSIQGVEITKSGILAAAHLAGPRNVMLFLESDGQINPQDMFNTSIMHYMKEFSIYKL